MLRRLIFILQSYEDGTFDSKADIRELLKSLPFDVTSNPLFAPILENLENPAIRTLIYRFIATQLKNYGSFLPTSRLTLSGIDIDALSAANATISEEAFLKIKKTLSTEFTVESTPLPCTTLTLQ